jgi:hypothetical protein
VSNEDLSDDIVAIKLAIIDLDDAIDELERAIEIRDDIENVNIAAIAYSDAVVALNRALEKLWASDRPPTIAGEE